MPRSTPSRRAYPVSPPNRRAPCGVRVTDDGRGIDPRRCRGYSSCSRKSARSSIVRRAGWGWAGHREEPGRGARGPRAAHSDGKAEAAEFTVRPPARRRRERKPVRDGSELDLPGERRMAFAFSSSTTTRTPPNCWPSPAPSATPRGSPSTGRGGLESPRISSRGGAASISVCR